MANSKIKPIRTEKDYEAALARIDALMEAKPGSTEFDDLDVLVDLVEHYESKHEPMAYRRRDAPACRSRSLDPPQQAQGPLPVGQGLREPRSSRCAGMASSNPFESPSGERKELIPGLSKLADQISVDDIAALIEADVPEGDRIEFKDAPPAGRKASPTPDKSLSRSPPLVGSPGVVLELLELLVAVGTRPAATRMQPDRNFQRLWTFIPSATA